MIMPASDPTRSGSSPVAGTGGAVVLSLSETEALCTRAARGAGLDWGHAEEAGRAAAWLAGRGVAACAPVLRCLQMQPLQPPDPQPGRWAGRGALCPLRSGAAFADHASLPEGLRDAGLTLETAALPVLLLPFIAQAARLRGTTIEVTAGDVVLLLQPDGGGGDAGAMGALAEQDATDVTLRPRTDTSATGQPGPARELPATPLAVWQALDALALRATVPPSESSLAGAGGTGDDND